MARGIRNVKIRFNTRKEWARKVAREVAEFLKRNNFLIINGKTQDSKPETTICVGGDGTILYYNNIGEVEGPVLGIGSASSHICALRNDNWKEKIVSVLRNGKSEPRLCLSASVASKSGKTKKSGNTRIPAINDIVIHTTDYRVITIRAIVNGVPHEFSGDGVIVSTPTGSSAYAYSAGGDILEPQSRLIEIVPICPYKRTISHMILDEDAEISISSNRDADLIIDGIYIQRISEGETVKVKKGKDVRFLVL